MYILRAENFRVKKPAAKVKIWNLINYLAVCCQVHSGTTVSKYQIANYYIQPWFSTNWKTARSLLVHSWNLTVLWNVWNTQNWQFFDSDFFSYARSWKFLDTIFFQYPESWWFFAAVFLGYEEPAVFFFKRSHWSYSPARLLVVLFWILSQVLHSNVQAQVLKLYIQLL
jgi:hypothetical protein